MVLSEEQLALLEAAEIVEGVNESQQNALIAKDERWPEGVLRYELDPNIQIKHRYLVEDTLKALEAKFDSCIKFVQTNSGNRVYVKDYGRGCSAQVGYQNHTNQGLVLLRYACMYAGIIEHEFLHALGIYHHQAHTCKMSGQCEHCLDIMIS